MPSGAPLIGAVVERWRAATMSKPGGLEAEPAGAGRLAREPAAEPSNGMALEQAHRRLLRRSLEPGGEAPAEAAPRLARSLWQQDPA